MELVLSGQFCDITVLCRGDEGSQSLPMSRLVLAAVCPALKVTNAQVELQAPQGSRRRRRLVLGTGRLCTCNAAFISI